MREIDKKYEMDLARRAERVARNKAEGRTRGVLEKPVEPIKTAGKELGTYEMTPETRYLNTLRKSGKPILSGEEGMATTPTLLHALSIMAAAKAAEIKDLGDDSESRSIEDPESEEFKKRIQTEALNRLQNK